MLKFVTLSHSITFSSIRNLVIWGLPKPWDLEGLGRGGTLAGPNAIEFALRSSQFLHPSIVGLTGLWSPATRPCPPATNQLAGRGKLLVEKGRVGPHSWWSTGSDVITLVTSNQWWGYLGKNYCRSWFYLRVFAQTKQHHPEIAYMMTSFPMGPGNLTLRHQHCSW